MICPNCGSVEWLDVPNSDKWICVLCDTVVTAPPLEDDDY